jgi:putative N-acetyltransferase (TIGR04045 family)
MFDRVFPFVSPTIAVALAQERWHGQGSRALRRQVFCSEQGVFSEDDADRHDVGALTIVALSVVAGMHDKVVGTVRIYQDEDRIWYGGRLAVAPEYRRFSGVGDRLTTAAVSTGRALGAERFLATVQEANQGFFERQNFRVLSRLQLHDRPHVLMEADLNRFSYAASVAPSPAFFGSRARWAASTTSAA